MTDDRDIVNAVRRPGRGGGWTLRLHLVGVTFESTTEIPGRSKEQRRIAYELRDEVRARIAGAALRRLAFKLADSTARADIESFAIEAEGPGLPAAVAHDRYYDTEHPKISADHKALIAEALDYLTLRGVLDRHPEKRHLVRFRSTPSPEGGHRG